jgi:hypothetical protein
MKASNWCPKNEGENNWVSKSKKWVNDGGILWIAHSNKTRLFKTSFKRG